MTVERARIIKELEQSQNDARTADNGPPAGVSGRRSSDQLIDSEKQASNLVNIQTGNVQGALDRIGLKIDPSRLTRPLKAELSNAIEDFHKKYNRMPNDREVRAAQTALDYRQGTDYDIGTNVRKAFGLKEKE